MKPFDPEPKNGESVRPGPAPSPPWAGKAVQGTAAGADAEASGRDPLRGLADPAPAGGAPQAGAPCPSLWTRIKRAFQYGSQGGEAG